MIQELLQRIKAPELERGRLWWGGDAMSPYSHDENIAFANMSANDAAKLKVEFFAFKKAYDDLSGPEKLTLRNWAQNEFVEPTWRNGKTFARPEWTAKHFLQNGPQTDKLLDVAPAHGCHGALLYRDHYKLAVELHTCDFSPAYNKLLTLLGADVHHMDLRFDRLADLGRTFDVVTFTEVLEHVDQAAEDNACADLQTITRPGSRLLITFPAKALPNGQPRQDDPLGHVRQPNADAIAQKLRGFNIVERGKFNGGKFDQVFIIAERT